MIKILSISSSGLIAISSFAHSSTLVGSPFSFGIDAADDGTYATTSPGLDGSANNFYSADTPISVSTTHDVGAGEKLVGIMHLHNSAASTGALQSLTFGGQAVDFSNSFGSFTRTYVFFLDAVSTITDGTLAFTFDVDFGTLAANELNGSGSGGGGVDEFGFSLFSLAGAAAGGPRDVISTGAETFPGIEAAAGDFIIQSTMRNNGTTAGSPTTGMTSSLSQSIGNLKLHQAYGVGDGDTLIADGGSSTGFLTNTGFDFSGTRNDQAVIASFAPVPEPSSAVLMLLSGLALLRRRR